MELHDRLLYHQIHPVKLVTDAGTAAVAAICFWRHEPLLGAAVGFVPSVLVTAALLRWVDLDSLCRNNTDTMFEVHAP